MNVNDIFNKHEKINKEKIKKIKKDINNYKKDINKDITTLFKKIGRW